MKKIIFIFISCSISLINFGQSTKEQDQKSIKSMAGCYEVTFNYAETFSPDKNYKFHDREKTHALELAKIIEDTGDKISIQHLLIVGSKDSAMIVKHWRQDWIYQNTDLYTFDKGTKWKYKSLPKSEVLGQWTQKVYQVDDSPRYQGSSTWIHVDNKNYWENNADAPLPRREYTQRDDYNVLNRTNRQEITDYGWIHIQDNRKILRKKKSKDILIAQERGENVYKKVNPERCLAAEQWWSQNSSIWDKVRNSWDKVYKRNKDLIMKKQKNDIELFEILSKYNTDVSQKEVDKEINKFVEK